MRKVYCGVPIDSCKGGVVTLNALWTPDGQKNKKSGKLHSTHEEAFQCYCGHLQEQGYERVGRREFTLNGGAVLVLDKPSRFGAEFRGGKSGEASGKQSSKRFTPLRGRGALAERLGK